MTWVNGHQPLEPLVSDLLTDMQLPPINCLPVKKPFGALQELVLYPIHEESTLPYTSTNAITLLRSIGEMSAGRVCGLEGLLVGVKDN